MKNDPCDTATVYAKRIAKCTTIIDLKAIASEIKANLATVAGWEDWLRDCYSSAYKCLTTPQKPIEKLLNKEGLKALERGEI